MRFFIAEYSVTFIHPSNIVKCCCVHFCPVRPCVRATVRASVLRYIERFVSDFHHTKTMHCGSEMKASHAWNKRSKVKITVQKHAGNSTLRAEE